MSDLVERLRSDGENERQRFREARATLGPLLADAAARIEQLEAALEDIAYPNPLHNEDDLMRIARAALEASDE